MLIAEKHSGFTVHGVESTSVCVVVVVVVGAVKRSQQKPERRACKGMGPAEERNGL